MGKPFIFGKTDFTIGFADPIFLMQGGTFLELGLQTMGDFYEKPHFTMENFKYWKGGWGLKIFGPKYQKAHPYAKSGRINCLAYVVVAVFIAIRRREKKAHEIADWKLESSITLQPIPRCRHAQFCTYMYVQEFQPITCRRICIDIKILALKLILLGRSLQGLNPIKPAY